MSDVDIVKRYNAVVKGISNYYSLSTRQSVLYELFYFLRRSCALTLAHKHKKKYAKWAFDKYGEDLRIVVDSSKEPIGFYLPSISKDSYGPKSKKKSKEVSMSDLTMKIQGTTIPSTLHVVCHASEFDCCIPSCPNEASDWHHIKHRKKYKGSDSTRKLLSYIVKQIPICKVHHVSIHSGKYDGPSIRKLKGFIPENFLDD